MGKTIPVKIKVDSKPREISGIYSIPDQPKALLVLAHGAGAGTQHMFMEELASELSNLRIATLRFNFPYMETGRKAPSSAKQAVDTFEQVVKQVLDEHPGLPIYVGGKSYGGRMASHLLAEKEYSQIKGIIFYGFPLHAPGKDSKNRANHLTHIKKPMLFLQGEKDKLANIHLIKEVVEELPKATLLVYEHADHSFKRPKKISKESLVTELAKNSATWIS